MVLAAFPVDFHSVLFVVALAVFTTVVSNQTPLKPSALLTHLQLGYYILDIRRPLPLTYIVATSLSVSKETHFDSKVRDFWFLTDFSKHSEKTT